MNEMEMKARENHRNGNNCSASLAMAFAEKLGMSEAEANPVTLALLYKAAQEADEAGDTQQALDCYRMVYDLTADEEVGRIISERSV